MTNEPPKRFFKGFFQRNFRFKANKAFRFFDRRQATQGIIVTLAVIFFARDRFDSRHSTFGNSLKIGIHRTHQLRKFFNGYFVRRITDIESLRKNSFATFWIATRRKHAEHKVHRIVHRGKATFGNTAIHKLKCFAANKRRREIREHPRNSLAIDPRHKIHERPHEIERANYRPIQVGKPRQVAFGQEFCSRITPSASGNRSKHNFGFIFKKSFRIRCRLAINFGG